MQVHIRMNAIVNELMSRVGLALQSGLAIAAVILFATTSSQAAWPERSIRFVVPLAAGGGVDIMARLLADRLSQQLPHRVVVENMPGGGGSIAARAVAKSDPDGLTFLLAAPGHAAVPATYQPPPYDPIADFSPVSLVVEFPLIIVVRPDLPATTLPELIALLKANPGKYNYGSGGVGGAAHMPTELFMNMAGVSMTHVPFRGNSQASAALLSGQIDLVIDGQAPQLGNIADNRVRVLGVTTSKRAPSLPNVQAISEVLPGYEYPMWVAVFAPAKTPAAIIDAMSAEIQKAIQNPATRSRYEALQTTPVGSTPAELDQYFRRQLKFNADIAQRANIKLSN